jgi:phenol/toluene 2-monooxygenase (NADH) P4/A4
VSVAAIGSYSFRPRDTVEKFPAPLLYIGWDEHMMFPSALALPLPLETPFEQVIQQVLPKLYSQHPDFARIDWAKVQWFRGGTLFTPKLQGTLAEHGFKHKSVLRFRTPGLEGLRGSCG